MPAGAERTANALDVGEELGGVNRPAGAVRDDAVGEAMGNQRLGGQMPTSSCAR
jgi:hypothetical protein